ncbi:helix-turn-helix domain-containing protein [Streptomyces sp. NPDC006923]|uniref:helix-turn-helix domain-containing protein n=1 Tax=Streptomyces sp. NPDC006923 TaxID=3155355 RepID=UPI0033ED1746
MSIGKSPDGNAADGKSAESPADDTPYDKTPEDSVPVGKASRGKDSDDTEVPDGDNYFEEAQPSVGQVLHEARIAAHLTVEQVSNATRVRIPIVHAIEQDDFSRCGGDVYARGHVRMFARAVGIDPFPLIERFDAEHGGRPVPTPAAPMFEAERIRPERPRPNWTAAMVAAIVAVVGFVGFTAFGGADEAGQAKPAAEGPKPAETNAKPSASASAAPKPDPSDSAIAAAPQDKVTVKLSAIDDKSWISAKAHNGKLLYDGLLLKGASKTFQDDEQIDLILGNAGAIELFVNGKKVEDEFEPGQVERLTYTKGDPEVG